MFREMIPSVRSAETMSRTGKIENIVGMSIEASGGRAAIGDICRISQVQQLLLHLEEHALPGHVRLLQKGPDLALQALGGGLPVPEEDGTCIIETPEEIIDASVSTQMSNIRDILHDQLPAASAACRCCAQSCRR